MWTAVHSSNYRWVIFGNLSGEDVDSCPLPNLLMCYFGESFQKKDVDSCPLPKLIDVSFLGSFREKDVDSCPLLLGAKDVDSCPFLNLLMCHF
jgi:hypothetical protein